MKLYVRMVGEQLLDFNQIRPIEEGQWFINVRFTCLHFVLDAASHLHQTDSFGLECCQQGSLGSPALLGGMFR